MQEAGALPGHSEAAQALALTALRMLVFGSQKKKMEKEEEVMR